MSGRSRKANGRSGDGMMQFDVVIVGGGHGGAQVAVMLRTQKFEGSIAIVGDEPELPYEIGRASCRERVCKSVSISVVAVSLKKKKKKIIARSKTEMDRQS